jgi:hypothetical protein
MRARVEVDSQAGADGDDEHAEPGNPYVAATEDLTSPIHVASTYL